MEEEGRRGKGKVSKGLREENEPRGYRSREGGRGGYLGLANEVGRENKQGVREGGRSWFVVREKEKMGGSERQGE